VWLIDPQQAGPGGRRPQHRDAWAPATVRRRHL